MKKLLCIIMALTLILAMSACGGDSDNGPGLSASPTDVTPPASTPSPEPQPVSELYMCGIPLVLDGQPTGLSLEGIEYSEGVLTLKDGTEFDSNIVIYPCISFSGNLEIVVSGECSLSATGDALSISGGTADDENKSNLTITGGELTIDAPDAAGISITGTLTVDGCKLEVTGDHKCAYDGEIVIENDAEAKLP